MRNLLFCCILIVLCSVPCFAADNIFADVDCDKQSDDYCTQNYCVQKKGVDVFKLIGENDYKKAKQCFEETFVPCFQKCTSENARAVSNECNTLLTQCIN